MSRPRRRVIKKRAKIRKVRLDRGGYDSHGRYYGHGKPLYEVEINGETYNVRASDKKSLAREANFFSDLGLTHSEIRYGFEKYMTR